MRVGSLFAGIGGFDLAAARLGWTLVWASEIEAFPRQVHARRFAGCRHVGDISAWEPDPVTDFVDVLVGGWPCQDVSVAGLRAGLKGERSGLFFELVRIARRLRPRWLLLENVPGLFSSPSKPAGFGGLDFTAVLASLDQLGYGVAWRVLDAQFFGVPQRRRRVFLVGRLGAECPAPVLFESAGLRGDPAAGGEARARIASGTLSRALARVGGGDDPGANKGAPIVVGTLTGAPRGRGPSPGTDDAAGGRIVTGAVNPKWRSASGGPAGDEVPHVVVVADPIQANEARTYWNDGKNFKPHNLVVTPPAFEDAERNPDDALTDQGEPAEAEVAAATAPDQLALFGLPEVRARTGTPGHPIPSLLDPEADGVVAPTLRDGGRSAESKAGSSYDNTPVVVAFQQRTRGDDGRGYDREPSVSDRPHLDATKPPAVVFEPRLARNGRGAPADLVPPLKAESGESGKGDGAPIVVGLNQLTSKDNRTNPKPGDPASTLAEREHMAVFGFKAGYFTRAKDGGPSDVIPPLSADADKGDQDPLIFAGLPRRLTPVECERLQGFPDGWTCLCGAIETALAAAGLDAAYWLASDWRTLRFEGLTHACRCKDSARYRALGNAVAVPVVEWIMRRLDAVARLEAAA